MRRTTKLAIPAILASALLMAGCASSSGGAGDPSGTSSSDGDLGAAQAVVDQYLGEPEFIAPGEPIDIREALEGKLIYAIPATSANPFSQGIFTAIEEIAEEVGFTFVQWENQGTLAEYQRGIEQAIADGADLIDLSTGTDPRLLAPQIEAARAAGIKIIDSHASGVTQGVSPNVDATMAAPYEDAGDLQAAYTAVHSGGDANVLIISSDEIIGSPVQVQAIEEGLADYCGSCKVTTVNAPVAQWSTVVASGVRGALLADPTIDYILPLYDPEVQFILPVLAELGKSQDVHIVSYAGNPAALDGIAQGTVLMDVGESAAELGYALVDLEARVLLGETDLDVNRNIGLRIFDESNVADAGSPAEYSTGYGDAAEQGYRALWGMD